MCRNTLSLCNSNSSNSIQTLRPSCQSPSLPSSPSLIPNSAPHTDLPSMRWAFGLCKLLALPGMPSSLPSVQPWQSSSSQLYSTTSPPLLGSLSQTILNWLPQPFSPSQQHYGTNFPFLSDGVLGVSLKFLYSLKHLEDRTRIQVSSPSELHTPNPNRHYSRQGSAHHCTKQPFT